jgi:glutathione S-transferase
MLTFYHTPLSINSRRVWVTLLEKGLSFRAIEVDLSGDQFKPDFLQINPFHHIPVLVDDGFRVIESLAILDYLEVKYPTPSLMPEAPDAVAKTRMIEMVTLNELVPAINPLTRQMMGFGEVNPEDIEQAKQKADVVLQFYIRSLDNGLYFGDNQLTLADIVAGTFAPWFEPLGLPMQNYPVLQQWTARLMERPAWQITQPSDQALQSFRNRMQQLKAGRET